MIQRVLWPRRHSGDEPSPFAFGGKRSLRLTFHTASYANLPDEEALALEALRDLAHFPGIECLETTPTEGPHIEIGDLDRRGDQILVHVRRLNGGSVLTSIPFASQWSRVAAHIISQPIIEPVQTDTQAMLEVLLLARAHTAVDSDIFVTASPLLLRHRHTDSSISEANPRSPLETAQLVGLLLRSRGIFRAGTDHRLAFSRWMFYWALARHRLPDLWRYFGACLGAEQVIGADTGDLGGSIILRASHAIQARDAVGQQFYVHQDHSTQDQAAYHFNYLLLLLSGALDAEARVAHRAYGLAFPERRAGFHRKHPAQDAFLRGLQSAEPGLYSLVTSQRFRDTLTLVFEPRNRIHGAALRALTAVSVSTDETWLIVPDDLASEIWPAAQRLGSADRWGLRQHHSEYWLEPYSYATSVLAEGLAAINSVARETDVTKLFRGRPLPPLSLGPPNDDQFGERSRRRLTVLG